MVGGGRQLEAGPPKLEAPVPIPGLLVCSCVENPQLHATLRCDSSCMQKVTIVT